MFATWQHQTNDFYEQAACAEGTGALVNLFFSESIPDIIRAKAICRTCDVQIECLEGAVARHEPWGVWGGELFVNGRILPKKRPRGRPPKNREQLTA